MLARSQRLRRSADFSEVVRRGRRTSRPLLTLHLVTPPTGSSPAAAPAIDAAQAGLVVSKAVGGSVVRSRTSRRLRHLLRDRLPSLPAGSRLVVRAAPRAGLASSAALAGDLDSALAALRRPRAAR